MSRQVIGGGFDDFCVRGDRCGASSHSHDAARLHVLTPVVPLGATPEAIALPPGVTGPVGIRELQDVLHTLLLVSPDVGER